MLIRVVIGVQKTSHQSVPGGICSVKMLENCHFAHSLTKFWRGVRKLDCVAATTVQLVLCTFCKYPPLAVSPIQITGKQAAFSYTRVFNKVLQICISAEKVDFCSGRPAHPASKCDTNKVHCYVLQLIFQSNKAVVTSQTCTGHIFR